ncbi:hypothetical protein QM467_15880 [Rhodoblastus sp. 17X3]|uniref:hypothetical protein n=1 Tax=Rhodoblastus sp. 17X3 TaxID=3047026 RepID=UPI0024B801DA|nr:hypothetical protein [Rhodoblastus sp. 17X3]MDI9849535.1 hypothetical protein [Rhodoblastus sp. 17X3]
MAKNPDVSAYALDCDLFSDADHDAAIALGDILAAPALEERDPVKRARMLKRAEQKRLNYLNAHRLLLRVSVDDNVAPLETEPAAFERQNYVTAHYTPRKINLLIETHQARLSARSMATHLRNLIGFANHVAPLVDTSYLRKRAQEFEARAKLAPKTKSSYAIDMSEAPQFKKHYDKLDARDDKTYAGEFRRYLGAQKLAGVDLTAIDASFLVTNVAIANFERTISSKDLVQRLNALGCMLKAADLGCDVGPIFERVRQIRKASSNHPGRMERRALDFETLPEAVKQRFIFVTTYDGKSVFTFNTHEIRLPKARRRNGREFSPNHIKAMQMALRHHFTILRDRNSPAADEFTHWGDADPIRYYQEFYANSDFVTQTSRLEELVSALRAIFGDSERQLFVRERREINRLNALRRLIDDNDLGFDLRAAGNPDLGEDSEPVEPPSTEELGRRCREFAERALKRFRDLRKSPLPYRDPKQLARQYRTALIVAFLADHPVRLRTLASLQKEHVEKPRAAPIRKSSETPLSREVAVPGSLTKGGMRYARTMYEDLSILFDAWFDEVRPALLGDRPDPSAVFISDEGKPLSRSGFGRALPAFTKAIFGFRIYPHLVRKLHGTELIGDRQATARRLHQSNLDSQIDYQDWIELRDQDRGLSLQQLSLGFFAVDE